MCNRMLPVHFSHLNRVCILPVLLSRQFAFCTTTSDINTYQLCNSIFFHFYILRNGGAVRLYQKTIRIWSSCSFQELVIINVEQTCIVLKVRFKFYLIKRYDDRLKAIDLLSSTSTSNLMLSRKNILFLEIRSMLKFKQLAKCQNITLIQK